MTRINGNWNNWGNKSMHLEKEELIQIIKDALKEQYEAAGCGTPYVFLEGETEINVDGLIDIGKMADKIIVADLQKYRNPYE